MNPIHPLSRKNAPSTHTEWSRTTTNIHGQQETVKAGYPPYATADMRVHIGSSRLTPHAPVGDILPSAKRRQEAPGSPRKRQETPGSAKRSQEAPGGAGQPIVILSICSPRCDSVGLGTTLLNSAANKMYLQSLRARAQRRVRAKDGGSVDLNVESPSGNVEKDDVCEILQIRPEPRLEIAVQGASLTDLALASWHLKYVDQGLEFRRSARALPARSLSVSRHLHGTLAVCRLPNWIAMSRSEHVPLGPSLMVAPRGPLGMRKAQPRCEALPKTLCWTAVVPSQLSTVSVVVLWGRGVHRTSGQSCRDPSMARNVTSRFTTEEIKE